MPPARRGESPGIMADMQPSRPGRPDPRAAAQQAQTAAAMAGAVDLAAVKARYEAAARAQNAAAERRPSRPGAPARRSSTSPRPRSRPKPSTGPSRCRSCWTSGPSGAARERTLPGARAAGRRGRGRLGPRQNRHRREPALAQALRVQSIPAVYAVWRGSRPRVPGGDPRAAGPPVRRRGPGGHHRAALPGPTRRSRRRGRGPAPRGRRGGPRAG